jgi:hypothetical protein
LAYSKGGAGRGKKKKKKKERKKKAWKLNLIYIYTIHKQNIIVDKNISNSTKIHWP